MNPRAVSDVDEELKYKILGQDFIYDLLANLDILKPVVRAMEALQSFSTPIWKVVPYIRNVVKYLKDIDFSNYRGLPRLAKHISDLEGMTFCGVDLEEGFLVVNTSAEMPGESGETSRRPRKKKVEYTWSARELHECEEDGRILINDLVRSLEHRYEKCIHNVCHLLYRCVDFHVLISLLQGQVSNKSKPYNQVALAKHGLCDFTAFVDHVNSLPHIKDDDSLCIDSALSVQIFDKIKSALASLI